MCESSVSKFIMAGGGTDCACCVNRIYLEFVGFAVILYFVINLAFHFTDEGYRYYGADDTMWYVNVSIAVFSILAAVLLMVGVFIENTIMVNVFIVAFSAFCIASMIIHCAGLAKIVSKSEAAKEWAEKCKDVKKSDKKWCKENKPDTDGMEVEDWLVKLKKGILYSALNIVAVFVIWICSTCKAWAFNRHVRTTS